MRAATRLAVTMLLSLTLWSGGCAVTPVMPPRGALYTNQKAPLFPGRETGSKEGRASTRMVLFLFAWGDGSIDTAARNGQITQIKHLDYELYNVLGVYQRYTTIVRGE